MSFGLLRFKKISQLFIEIECGLFFGEILFYADKISPRLPKV